MRCSSRCSHRRSDHHHGTPAEGFNEYPQRHASHHPTELLSTLIRSLWEGKEAPPAYLERLGLTEAGGFKEMVLRRLFAGNL